MRKLKQFIKKIPLIRTLTKSIYKNLSPHKHLPTYWIDRYLDNHNLDVVQIGSNDGVADDPISELVLKNDKWNVVFVEPVPWIFEKLKENYPAHPRFSFENTAVNDGADQVFYSVKEEAIEKIPDLPDYYDKLGSFYKEHILNHLDGILEPYIEETIVQGVALNQLFKRNNVNKLELLHIDTEGYDYKILSQLNLDKYAPSIILFEYMHLSASEKRQSIAFLRDKYYIFKFGGDLLCIKINVFRNKDLDELEEQIVNGLHHN